MKKKVHPRPEEYRIIYRINGSVSESTQYYSVYHSSEALDFLAHTLRRGHIHGDSLLILAIEEYNRFSDKWTDRMTKAMEHTEAQEVTLQDNKLYLRSCLNKTS